MNVAIYCRYSCSKQQETSIEGQLKVCHQFCESNGYNVIKTYIDRATSGSKDIEKRTEFLKMIRESKEFDAVVVYALDRFSRDPYDIAIFERDLEINHCKLLSATETNEETAQAFLMRGILKEMAVYYSKELSQKVRRGTLVAKSKHQYTGGIIPYGFKIDHKKYLIDETQAPIVVEIFERVSLGEPFLDIARDFNKRSIPSSNGGKWNRSSFHRILSNNKYKGCYSYKNEEGEIITDIDAVPRIVSDELWEACQVAKQRKVIRMSKYEYLLSGKLYYKDKLMYGSTSTSRGVPHSYYCVELPTCRKYIKKEYVEFEVIDQLAEHLTEDVIDEICHQAVAENKRLNLSFSNESINQSIKEKKRQISNLTLSMSKLTDPQPAIDLINQLSDEIRDLESQQFTKFDFTFDQFKGFFKGILNNTEDDPAFKRSLIIGIIKKIELSDDNSVKIILNTTKDIELFESISMVGNWIYNSNTYYLYISL